MQHRVTGEPEYEAAPTGRDSHGADRTTPLGEHSFCPIETARALHVPVHRMGRFFEWPSPAQVRDTRARNAASPFSESSHRKPGPAFGNVTRTDAALALPQATRSPASPVTEARPGRLVSPRGSRRIPA
jgi:hypothetical protein